MAVWIGNLKESVTDEDLKRFFSRCTEKGAIAIASCKVMRDENGQSRKFGYVNFHSDADAEAAAEAMDGVKIHSVPIKTKGPGTLRSSGHSTNVSLTDCLYYSQSGNCKKGNQVCPPGVIIYAGSTSTRPVARLCVGGGGGGGGGGAKQVISGLNQWCSQDNTCMYGRAHTARCRVCMNLRKPQERCTQATLV